MTNTNTSCLLQMKRLSTSEQHRHHYRKSLSESSCAHKQFSMKVTDNAMNEQTCWVCAHRLLIQASNCVVLWPISHIATWAEQSLTDLNAEHRMKSDINGFLMPILSKPQFSSHRLLMWAHIKCLFNTLKLEIITSKESLIYYMAVYLTISHNNFIFRQKTVKLYSYFCKKSKKIAKLVTHFQNSRFLKAWGCAVSLQLITCPLSYQLMKFAFTHLPVIDIN